MKISDVKDLAMLGAIGIGVYVVYKFWKNIPSTKDISNAAKGAYNLLTTSPVNVQGKVHLPTGEYIAVNDIVNAGGVIDATGSFTWRGTRYTILSRGADGAYEVM